MDEVKNMLDYKVGHYARQVDLTYDQNKKNPPILNDYETEIFPRRQ